MNRSLTKPFLVSVLALALGSAACGGGTTSPSPTTSAGNAATNASARREVALVSSVRPIIVSTLDALRPGDVAAAKKAWSAYDGAWNGIEVYVNFRSRDLYGQLETELQAGIDKALGAAQPDVGAATKLVESLLTKYDEAIALSTSGPAISPLFDDIASVRIARAPLRAVSPALRANDLATAKERYGAFAKAYPDARPLLQRAADAFAELEAAKGRVDAAFPSAPSAGPELGALVNALSERYNYALSLLNTAARAADLSKTAFGATDATQAAGLGLVEAELRASQALWDAGDVGAAGAHATRAAGARFDAVSDALRAKAADVNVKKALDAYVPLAGQTGDAAKVRAAQKSAIEAVLVGQQALVGQFWADPKLHAAIVRGLAGALATEYAAPAGYQSAWGILAVIERRAAGASLTDTIAVPDQQLRAALPDAAKPPQPRATNESVSAAATALANAVP